MSYEIELQDPITKEVLVLDAPHQMRGGIYAVGGIFEARLNITYNYAPIFQQVFGDASVDLSSCDQMFGGSITGIPKLYGLPAVDSIPVLQKAIDSLRDDVDLDYWKPTYGNAKRVLIQLLTLAKLRPDGVWMGD